MQSKVQTAKNIRPRQRKVIEQEEVPLPKTHFKRLEVENSKVLKMFRQ